MDNEIPQIEKIIVESFDGIFDATVRMGVITGDPKPEDIILTRELFLKLTKVDMYGDNVYSLLRNLSCLNGTF